ncbi:hypothetical protein V1508DRAFT_412753 [Lipomyces doorenjongii]|uniref:uncharacterized protein n=1 Tax=Lipomyces doorenjongii TaxID=383834 RepID=UPI0034CDA809
MPAPIDISYQRPQHQHHRFRRESVAHSQGMGGISWGGISVGSWLKDEVMMMSNSPFVGSQTNIANGLNFSTSVNMSNMSPSFNSGSYLTKLEANFCRDYNCCGERLPTLHDLLQHYEEAHISPSPPPEPIYYNSRPMQVFEAVSTNEVFLSPEPSDAGTPMMMDEEEDEMCIDDPARHLYVMDHQGDDKPYKCPVIGCEKAYKNQNGLKYHRQHGHQNQVLRQNEDGTLTVISPDNEFPYPDYPGLEKDKPYRCEVCGKRYKNLNGLKYHRGHTTH